MRKEFDDYFTDNILSVNTTADKPYIMISAESNDEMASVAIDKDSLKELIEYLQAAYKNM